MLFAPVVAVNARAFYADPFCLLPYPCKVSRISWSLICAEEDVISDEESRWPLAAPFARLTVIELNSSSDEAT